LHDSAIIPQEGAQPIVGDALAELVRQYNTANAIVMRLSGAIDPAALSAIINGCRLNLDDADSANASAEALTRAINDPAIEVVVRSDELSAKHSLRIQRRHFGNMKVSVIDAEFLHGPDYQTLSNAAATFKG
ncbi:hypothetical protein, partial [Pseudomonas nitroreducens]